MSSGTAERRLLWVVLTLLVVLAWANGLHGEFTYDDKVEVVGNRTIRTLEEWGAVLAYNASRPVVILTWALNWRLGGLDPFGYHLGNVLVHVLNAILALALGEEVGRRLGWPRPLVPAAVAAALWAVHPMTTEAVTYVTGRSEALCATFYLGAVVQWLRWRREGGAFPLAISFASFLLAAATKEVAATVPLALLLTEALPGGGLGDRKVRRGLAPFFAILALGAVLRKLLYGVFTTDLWLRPLDVQLRTQAEVVVRYLQLWLAPVGQSVFHDHPPAEGFGVATVISLLLLAGMLALAVAERRRRPWVPFVVGWFLLVLVPSSSLVPLKETMAEHRAYLSGWAVVFGAVALLAPRLAGRRRLAVSLVVVTTVALGTATHLRNRAWHTEVGLWTDAVTRNPGSAEAWYGLGDALRFQRRFQEAMQAYREAVVINDGYADARNNIGICLAELGHAEAARDVWLATLRQHPSYCKAHNNLGWLHYRRRQWDEATAEFLSTLTWCPDDLLAHLGLGHIAYGPRRDPARAVAHYQRVLDLDPSFQDREAIKARLLELTW